MASKGSCAGEDQMKVCIMLACYNRRKITKKCLAELLNQFPLLPTYEFEVYVYDDCSNDGTSEMIQEEFPQIKLIIGKHGAFWCKSMYYLMNLVSKKEFDYYLMINDDVQFDKNALNIMFQSYNSAACSCGIVGSTRSAQTGMITYGGRDRSKKLLEPNGSLQQCHWANWNCFLIDKKVLSEVGIIDKKYQHSWGDFDYSYRMNKKGIPIYSAIDYVGTCEHNSLKGTFRDNTLKRGTRLKKLFSAKGLPIYSYFRYNIKTEGSRGLWKAIYGYASLIWYIVLNKKIE